MYNKAAINIIPVNPAPADTAAICRGSSKNFLFIFLTDKKGVVVELGISVLTAGEVLAIENLSFVVKVDPYSGRTKANDVFSFSGKREDDKFEMSYKVERCLCCWVFKLCVEAKGVDSIDPVTISSAVDKDFSNGSAVVVNTPVYQYTKYISVPYHSRVYIIDYYSTLFIYQI